MDIRKFTHDGATFLDWNGVNFQALRLFAAWDYNGTPKALYFAQLTGRAPLTKDDLPDAKHNLIRTKAGKTVVFTVYRKDLVNYETDAKSAKWLFIAPTEAGAWFLALRSLVRRHGLTITDEAVRAKSVELAATEQLPRHILGWDAVTRQQDEAGGAAGIMVEWEPARRKCSERDVRELFKMEECYA